MRCITLKPSATLRVAANGIGVAPLARVSSCDDPNTQVLLDNGVMGIVFPDISTADQARRAVARSKFPPVGRRSVVGGDRHLARQTEMIRKGMRFITTNSDIAFILAEGSRVTGELRTALG